MPYTLSFTPAPLTFTIRPKFDWKILPSIAWGCFLAYEFVHVDWRHIGSIDVPNAAILIFVSLVALLSLIRRERVEVYPDQMVWRKTYFGFTRSKAVPLNDVLGAEWNEGEKHGEDAEGPDYVEFYSSTGSVKACFGFSFEDFERMREDIRKMYPALVNRWGTPSVRSKNLTLLNLH